MHLYYFNKNDDFSGFGHILNKVIWNDDCNNSIRMNMMNAIERTNTTQERHSRITEVFVFGNRKAEQILWEETINFDRRSAFVCVIWLEFSKHPNTQIRTLSHCTSFSLLVSFFSSSFDRPEMHAHFNSECESVNFSYIIFRFYFLSAIYFVYLLL